MRTLEEVLAAHPFPFELEQLQKEDIVALAGWGRGIGDLPVGYGKTPITTAISLMLQPDLTIIIVPPILIDPWCAWLRSIPNHAGVVAYDGPPKKRAAMDITKVDFLVMSYGMFRNDFDRLLKGCRGAHVMLAVDEAQNVKNSQSQLWKCVKQFSDPDRPLYLMSGTLMSNPGDAYAYIKLTNPAAYRSWTAFCNIHVEERDFFDQPLKWGNLDLMQTNLNFRRRRRTKEEVHAALPKPRYIPVYYDLPKEHLLLYRRLMTEQLLVLDDGSKIDATTPGTLYNKAQQIITNWGHFAGDPTKRSKVYDLVDEVCDEIGFGQDGASKLILWTQFTMTSAAMYEYMQQKAAAARPGGYSAAAYSKVNSRKLVQQFMDDPNCLALPAHPMSAGAGLNPQHVCWECGFVETPTRTIQFVQSSGRIDRKGQKYNPNIRIFIARHTVQEGLFKSLLENDDLVNRASGTAKGIRSLIFPD